MVALFLRNKNRLSLLVCQVCQFARNDNFGNFDCFDIFDEIVDFEDFAFLKRPILPEKPIRASVCWFIKFSGLLLWQA